MRFLVCFLLAVAPLSANEDLIQLLLDAETELASAEKALERSALDLMSQRAMLESSLAKLDRLEARLERSEIRSRELLALLTRLRAVYVKLKSGLDQLEIELEEQEKSFKQALQRERAEKSIAIGVAIVLAILALLGFIN